VEGLRECDLVVCRRRKGGHVHHGKCHAAESGTAATAAAAAAAAAAYTNFTLLPALFGIAPAKCVKGRAFLQRSYGCTELVVMYEDVKAILMWWVGVSVRKRRLKVSR